MHQLNIENLIGALQQRIDNGGVDPAVMTLSLAVNPNRRHGESRYRAIVRTNEAPDMAVALRLPAYESGDEGEEEDDASAAAAPASSASQDDAFVNVPSAAPPTPSTNLSSLTTITSTGSVHAPPPGLAVPTPAFTFPGLTPSSGLAGDAAVERGPTQGIAATNPRTTPLSLASWARNVDAEDDSVDGSPPRASSSRSAISAAGSSLIRTRRAHSYLQLQILHANVEGAPDGDAWYAIAVGFETGVVRGPFSEIRDLVNGYKGCHFRGFSKRQAAVAWYHRHLVPT
ncbi:hypothetical protein FA95DRAFT_1613904 [Auriscalpium vulgare]|uniref:Uncharacterized protein n=1 Tax=Auriscalpium vulgare TaxID=40419 RepID=A0ACB8R1G5_9AGAM|nr:hypothetical protein FA95DRAFT_1613904 [Auriscalpium vulgare]